MDDLKFTEEEIKFIKKEFKSCQYWYEEGLKVDILKKLVDFIDKPNSL